MRVVDAGADGCDGANGGNGRGDRLTIFLAALLAVLTTFNDRLQRVHRAVLGSQFKGGSPGDAQVSNCYSDRRR